MRKTIFKDIRQAFMGTREARADYETAILENHNIKSGIRQLETLHPVNVADDDEKPIFLFCAGWRSGSTLLQRLLMSDPRALIWGEPYNACNIIQRTAKTTLAFRPDWPPNRYYYDGTDYIHLKDKWIANLYPMLNDLWRGHRALFDSMYSDPAKGAGALQWGIKEVRLDAAHAYYLRWLYPKARFLFLYRNPLVAYQSYVGFGRDCYNTWPDKPVFTPTEFGLHWHRLIESFICDSEELGAMLIRYEDLNNGDELIRSIEQYLDIRIDRSVLHKKVGASDIKKVSLNHLERWLLKRAVSPIAQELGYKW